jgi:hypothetical protein
MLIFLSRTIFRFSKNNFSVAIESLRSKKPTLQGLSFSPANPYSLGVIVQSQAANLVRF